MDRAVYAQLASRYSGGYAGSAGKRFARLGLRRIIDLRAWVCAALI
jgi:hypothetical protein